MIWIWVDPPGVLFDCASRIERQKFDFDSDVELLHVPNQLHTSDTLRINYRSLSVDLLILIMKETTQIYRMDVFLSFGAV